jgi:hypothetical protein
MENALLKCDDKFKPLSESIELSRPDLSQRLIELFTAYDFLGLHTDFKDDIMTAMKEENIS